MQDTLSAVGSLTSGETGAFTNLASLSARPTAASTSNAPATTQIPPAEDPLLQLIAGTIQRNGNRQKAQRIVTRTLMYIHTLTRAPPLPILRNAIFTVAPAVRCISVRHAGRTIVYPIALNEQQRMHHSIQWILAASDARPGQFLEERLAREMVAIVQGTMTDSKEVSPAIRKKEDVHKLALSNRGNVQKGRY
ncbi:37S ribosomal protein S7, mitochondrial [Sparassis crispa]|uniref:37S ribosomal protein S7, mitochondrial n=1 Tax=Sparassis crispa TaxID=139825 RepID=A0A401H420_9APHY|nr:37S ribosomal protein S7, mitochondrial [Sparassis crispa]GBE89162.1 37S ribosomal protein S7, mitochondrial [Sparassis crispa]